MNNIGRTICDRDSSQTMSAPKTQLRSVISDDFASNINMNEIGLLGSLNHGRKSMTFAPYSVQSFHETLGSLRSCHPQLPSVELSEFKSQIMNESISQIPMFRRTVSDDARISENVLCFKNREADTSSSIIIADIASSGQSNVVSSKNLSGKILTDFCREKSNLLKSNKLIRRDVVASARLTQGQGRFKKAILARPDSVSSSVGEKIPLTPYSSDEMCQTSFDSTIEPRFHSEDPLYKRSHSEAHAQRYQTHSLAEDKSNAALQRRKSNDKFADKDRKIMNKKSIHNQLDSHVAANIASDKHVETMNEVQSACDKTMNTTQKEYALVLPEHAISAPIVASITGKQRKFKVESLEAVRFHKNVEDFPDTNFSSVPPPNVCEKEASCGSRPLKKRARKDKFLQNDSRICQKRKLNSANDPLERGNISADPTDIILLNNELRLKQSISIKSEGVTINDNDIMCSKNNTRFVTLIEHLRKSEGSNGSIDGVIAEVRNLMREKKPFGRFLELDCTSSIWIEMDDDSVRDYVNSLINKPSRSKEGLRLLGPELNSELEVFLASMNEVNVGPPTIKYPGTIDILFGRGAAMRNHPGNVAFRDLVEKYRDEYNMVCRTSLKKVLAKYIMSVVRLKNGRFLKMDSDLNMWYEVGDVKALEKIRMRLRQRIPMEKVGAIDAEEMPKPNLV